MSKADKEPNPYYAAIDLGSNSFHMIVARRTGVGINVTDRLRSPVRLAAGLTEDGGLSSEAQERALSCLTQFGQRLRDLPSEQVRAVGTNALRQAKMAGDFLEQAEKALGHRIEIIPGIEEARLIYLGVSHSIADDHRRRIVVDIGGGSTECILGSDFKPITRHSLYMGCVSYTKKFFADGILNRGNYERAKIAAEQEFQPLVQSFSSFGWREAIGSSGTLCGIQEILEANNWGTGKISLEGLEHLREYLLSHKEISEISINGLTKDRRPVIIGGLAIVDAFFEIFGIDSMKTSKWSLREGLVYEMSGASTSTTDIRNETVTQMQEAHGVDKIHAIRVEDTALHIWKNTKDTWHLDEDENERLLRWASALHEIGLSISYAGHHKHAAYLIEHCAMAGFSQNLKHQLALLVRYHRRKFNRGAFNDLPSELRDRTVKLALILRLAILLHRSRDPHMDVLPDVLVAEDTMQLKLDDQFLRHHPLTVADLDDEKARLNALGFQLEFV